MATSNGDEIYFSKLLEHQEDKQWVPLKLTLVEYPKGKAFISPPLLPLHSLFFILGDLLGKFLALITLTPYVIVSGFLTLILFRRDLHTVRPPTAVVYSGAKHHRIVCF